MTMSAWDLLISGEYLAAAEALSPRVDEGDLVSLHNRGTALLAAGEPQGAVADFERLIKIRPENLRNDGDYLMLGAALWHLGEFHRAVGTWQAGVGAPYTDAAGGVQCPAILLYAGERLGDHSLRAESIQLLERAVRRKPRIWPAPIAVFLLGQLNQEQVDEHARTGVPERLANRQQAQADFYVGVQALRLNDLARFETRMRSSASNARAVIEPEHHLATWEVQHGLPDPATFRRQFEV
jgi:tetratricopeptide (TPR) repeat protein